MAEALFPIMEYNDVPEGVIDRGTLGKDFRGFFLTVDTVPNPDRWYAHYTDGVIEEITPINGKPRPVPDLAVRTKGQKVNTSTAPGVYTGIMRWVAQAYSSQGKLQPFQAAFTRTHGILEYPHPRIVGGTKTEEQTIAATRRHWVIEISDQGVYIAPIPTLGITSLSCVRSHQQYKQTPASGTIDLAWAFTNKNPENKIVRLKTAAEMADAYFNGVQAYGGPSWAFSYSGRRASTIGSRQVNTDEPTVGPDDFTVSMRRRLIDLEFDVIPGSGETPDEYSCILTIGPEKHHNHTNGHVVYNDGIFSGDYGRSMWVTDFWSDGHTTDGVFLGVPFGPSFLASLPQDCPVFVFYEGERKILISWSRPSSSPTSSGFIMTADPAGPPYDVNAFVPGNQLSMLILFKENREAVGLLTGTLIPATSPQQWNAKYRLFNRSAIVEIDFVLDTAGATVEDRGVVFAIVGCDPPIGNFLFPYAPFATFLPRQNWIDADLYAFGGSLFYSSPELDPTDQKVNAVRRFDEIYTMTGGFTGFGTRTPVFFVGKV